MSMLLFRSRKQNTECPLHIHKLFPGQPSPFSVSKMITLLGTILTSPLQQTAEDASTLDVSHPMLR
jgi:hypothetical protein